MSRRHKENDIEQSEPHEAESQGDGSIIGKCFSSKSTNLLNKMLVVVKQPESSLTTKLSDAITCAILKAFQKREVVMDDKWLKIPSRYVKSSLFNVLHELEHIQCSPPPEKKEPKRGRGLLTRLIDKFEDSQVVDWFKNTWNVGKQIAKEICLNITQFTVCFLKGIHEAFCPDDDPYGKISHYHRMLAVPDEPEKGIPNIPSRVTINRNYKWFTEWREAVTYEDGKAKRKRHKHRIWKRLVQWIKEYLLTLAPQYAAQPVYGVGI